LQFGSQRAFQAANFGSNTTDFGLYAANFGSEAVAHVFKVLRLPEEASQHGQKIESKESAGNSDCKIKLLCQAATSELRLDLAEMLSASDRCLANANSLIA
jgi:hypothetical protein